ELLVETEDLYSDGCWRILDTSGSLPTAFVSLANAITTAYDPQASLRFQHLPSESGLNPDAVSCVSPQTDNTVSWSDMQHIFEIADTSFTADYYDTCCRLAEHVRGIFQAQDTRQSVVALTLHRRQMCVWFFDRSGAIRSSPFNINERPSTLVRVVAGLQDM